MDHHCSILMIPNHLSNHHLSYSTKPTHNLHKLVETSDLWKWKISCFTRSWYYDFIQYISSIMMNSLTLKKLRGIIPTSISELTELPHQHKHFRTHSVVGTIFIDHYRRLQHATSESQKSIQELKAHINYWRHYPVLLVDWYSTQIRNIPAIQNRPKIQTLLLRTTFYLLETIFNCKILGLISKRTIRISD